MTVDEFETLRLLDNEGLTQEQCAARMNVSRTTVTAIYDSARKKIGDVLVNGKRLLITGGNCRFTPQQPPENLIEKGQNTMRIAVTYDIHSTAATRKLDRERTKHHENCSNL